ncbi:MAG TPA: inositol monophosphatase family protein [Candidatus Limnocylindrales bacterium]|nr:inositol monophosphatase family protein [Candidatus Limnocylindrales bacterium]
MPGQPAQRATTRDLRQFALDLLDETDAIALRHLAQGLTVSSKPDATLVTQADTEIEALLRQRIEDAFPSHGIVGEELGTAPGDGETRWILDPIDGTHNLVRGIPIFGTLIAVEREGVLVAATISAPALSRRWHAARGQGAAVRDLLGERPIRVSAVDRLEEAQIVTSSVRAMEDAGFRDALARLGRAAWRDRGFGEFWGYMLVAEGAAEVMLEVGVKLWDLAAPALIVAEAGGRLTDFAGHATYAGPQALATNGLVDGAVLSLLRGR